MQATALSIVVLGASGDLAKKKTFPSLFGLFKAKLLPPHTNIVGFARSELTNDELRSRLRPLLPSENSLLLNKFLERVTYCRGDSYADDEAFAALAKQLERLEAESHPSRDGGDAVLANRLFYFALPPSVYAAAAACVGRHGYSKSGWTRLVIEKPFGRDYDSCKVLLEELHGALGRERAERDVYRIDHYLGKEMVQSLLVLRFANRIFEPLWNREHIANVQITFKENFGTMGRGGYFDSFGIIRDVMQNHLMQVLALAAMEPPRSNSPSAIIEAKLDLLRCVRHEIPMEHVVVGQYSTPGPGEPAYRDDESITNKDTITPTYAAIVFFIENERWRGVPFIMKAGKALNQRKTEVRIQFKAPEASPMFPDNVTHQNELVIKIQPGESVYAKFMCKTPGFTNELTEAEMDLSYNRRFPCVDMPDAYERLILEALLGDRSNFVGELELLEAWRIFTPLLQHLESSKLHPLAYTFGSRGPAEADALVAKFGYRLSRQYQWSTRSLVADGVRFRDALTQDLTVPTSRLRLVLETIREHMRMGLRGDKRASIKMIPSFVTRRPSPRMKRVCWALDLGGTNFRVVRVELRGDGTCSVHRAAEQRVPDHLRHGASAEALFGWMAEVTVSAVGKEDDAPLGFTFSFPVHQRSINSGSLMHWTKDWAVEGVVGEDVCALLNAALERLGARARVTALINDTVGTLLAGALDQPLCGAGVILGTGSNAAYLERTSAIEKWDGTGVSAGDAGAEFMVINTEWGGFNGEALDEEGKSSNVLPRVEADVNMDLRSEDPRAQLLEKLISGRYLGEIVRRLLLQMQSVGDVWRRAQYHASAPILQQYGVDTEALSRILAAVTDSQTASAVEEWFGVNGSTASDLDVIKEMCHLVSTRSARLAAAGIAAVVFAMRDSRVPAREDVPDARPVGEERVVVGVDGSLFEKMPGYPEALAAALEELGAPCELALAKDGSGLGAALAAAQASE